jgi:hypothetical protein
MRSYLVECYEPGVQVAAVAEAAARSRSAASALRAEGRDIEYIQAVLVPEDEVIFHLFRAVDADAVQQASERAHVAFDRIVETISLKAATG